jgi:DMSO/TMAO reductase YedYZ molybdopterin-dependent catalytic subunit
VWAGVRLSDLIAECQPEPIAKFLCSSGADHGVFEGDPCDTFTKDFSLDRVSADVLIAYAMNGTPLRPRLPRAGSRARILRDQQRQMADSDYAGGQASDRAIYDALVQ